MTTDSQVTAEACRRCILDDLSGALHLLPDISEEKKQEILASARQFLDGEFNLSRAPSYYITGVHRRLKQIAGLPVPFAELRHACNEVGRVLAEKLRRRLEVLSQKEGFRLAVEWAIAANHLDFRTVGTGYGFSPDEIEAMLEAKLRKGFAVDDFDSLWDLVHGAREILYIPDNVGELAFDNIVLDYLRDFSCHTIVPYRGGPITSDATLEDFNFLNTQAHAGDVICAGPDTLGISLEEASDELHAALQRAELIITKGQANFYAMHASQHKLPGRIACLFTCKCDVVAGLFGLSGKINIMKVLK
ncbi:MAG: ARMT1-like domain-containing protein [bacterium]